MTRIFYDIEDFDGLGACAVANRFYRDDAEPIGLDRGLKSKDKFFLDLDFKGVNEIVFVDLAPRTQQQLHRFIEIVGDKKITIIDHHNLLYNPSYYDNVDYIYRDDTSACKLTWEYYFGGVLVSPDVVNLINDRDVWLNEMQPYTNYFTNTFGMMDMEIVEYLIFDDDGSKLKYFLKVGAYKEAFRMERIAKKVENRIKVTTLRGHKVATPTTNLEKDEVSEVGNMACKKYGVSFFIYKERDYKYSLRSLNGEALRFIRENGFKGGGHPNSCGFSTGFEVLSIN